MSLHLGRLNSGFERHNFGEMTFRGRDRLPLLPSLTYGNCGYLSHDSKIELPQKAKR